MKSTSLEKTVATSARHVRFPGKSLVPPRTAPRRKNKGGLPSEILPESGKPRRVNHCHVRSDHPWSFDRPWSMRKKMPLTGDVASVPFGVFAFVRLSGRVADGLIKPSWTCGLVQSSMRSAGIGARWLARILCAVIRFRIRP